MCFFTHVCVKKKTDVMNDTQHSKVHSFTVASPLQSMINSRMYIVVNKSLKMGKGKIAAQCGHAVQNITLYMCNDKSGKYESYLRGGLHKKIVLWATQEECERLEKQNEAFPIRDCGLTQVPANSLTAIAFLPLLEGQHYDFLNGLKLL